VSQPEFYRRHLPHWQPTGATLFVTFRLAGSVPRNVSGPPEWQQQVDRGPMPVEDVVGSGPRWLANPQVASIVAEALQYRHGRQVDLLAFCIMPNHVHLVCTPLADGNGSVWALSRVLHSLKGRTAREANRILGRKGPFWQRESYDHVVRDADELERIVRYVMGNPVKAGLVAEADAWPWTYVKEW
jgi:putative transposase